MVGSATAPDYVYYNADIINNNTAETQDGNAFLDPLVRFNETRDTALLKNAQDYHFSIVRFTMNGPNRNLPLFIPTIQSGTGAVAVNTTAYSVGLSYQQSWNTTDVGLITFQLVPPQRPVIYISETRNPLLAPIPKTLASPQFRGLFVLGTTYVPGDIVSQAINPLTGNFLAPFFKVQNPNQTWQPNFTYGIGAYVLFNGLAYRAVGVPVVGVSPPLAPANWVIGITGIVPTTPPFWGLTNANQGSAQDLSSRYYWVYTYQHWLNLVNTTFRDAHFDLYQAFQSFWTNSGTLDPFPFATYQDFQNYVNVPQIVYDKAHKSFKLYGDSDGFGTRITAFVPTPAPAPIPHQTPPVLRMFFNTNLYGLFANFDNLYWNFTNATDTAGPFGGTPIQDSAGLPTTIIPPGYTNEILFTNKFWTNVEDYRLPPYSGVAPLGYVPPNGFTGANVIQQKPYWVAEQDWHSTDSLWSPISSIVFTSTLLPVRAEATGEPVIFGTGNIGVSAPTSKSAFQPIITDISVDTSSSGAEAYKTFIYYAPSAEYRLSDFTSSKSDIQNIDVEVFWKCRLDNQLYPVSMFNLSTVSLKVMFRHKDAQA